MTRVIVAGGPGVGKSTLLEALGARGYRSVGDHARDVIRERVSQGLPPRPEPRAFAAEVLERSIAAYAGVRDDELVFFDRAIPDALGALYGEDALSDVELSHLLQAYPYDRRVFLLPPWPEIYVTDAERDHTFEHCRRVHAFLERWYPRCGYATIEVPCTAVTERCAFVLDALRRRSHGPGD